MKTIKNIHDRARELKQERDQLIDRKRADAAADPMMTPSERSEYVAKWRAEYTKSFAVRFADLRDEVADYAERTRRQAANARPHLDDESTAQLVRTEQAWRNVVLPQLEKGRTLAAALRNADADAVLGAERFAPAWLQAQAPRSGLDGMALEVDGGKVVGREVVVGDSSVTRAVLSRLSALASNDEDRAALVSVATLDDVLPATERFIDHLESGQGSSLDVAIGLSLAMNQGDSDADSSEAA